MTRDPMGLLLAAARVDPTLMDAARQVENELERLRQRVVISESAAEALSRAIEDAYDCACEDWFADYTEGSQRCAAHTAYAAAREALNRISE